MNMSEEFSWDEYLTKLREKASAKKSFGIEETGALSFQMESFKRLLPLLNEIEKLVISGSKEQYKKQIEGIKETLKDQDIPELTKRIILHEVKGLWEKKSATYPGLEAMKEYRKDSGLPWVLENILGMMHDVSGEMASIVKKEKEIEIMGCKKFTEDLNNFTQEQTGKNFNELGEEARYGILNEFLKVPLYGDVINPLLTMCNLNTVTTTFEPVNPMEYEKELQLRKTAGEVLKTIEEYQKKKR